MSSSGNDVHGVVSGDPLCRPDKLQTERGTMDRKILGLIGAIGALVILYFASGSPIPLYTMYPGQLGLTHGDLSMTSVYYLVGTVVALLFFPRLSDHIGRRPSAACPED